MGMLPGDADGTAGLMGSLGSRLDATNSHIQQLQQDKSMLEAMLASST